jgi:hypothetical protein
MLEAMIPYTERHFARLDKLIQKSFLLDYTLQRMTLLMDTPTEPKKVNEKRPNEDNLSYAQ